MRHNLPDTLPRRILFVILLRTRNARKRSRHRFRSAPESFQKLSNLTHMLVAPTRSSRPIVLPFEPNAACLYNRKMRSKAGLALLFCCTTVFVLAQRKDMERPSRQPVRGTRGAIAGGTEFATEAGMRMYHRGGNAVDAGVATMFAASVAEYSHFGFGGEAPILIRTKDGVVHAIAGVGTMPKLATADFFRTRGIRPGELLALEPGG